MKIKKSLVEQIIKEEAVKVKKLIALQEEKKQILGQLNEMYEEAAELDEFWGSKGLSREEAVKLIMGHPAKRMAFEKSSENPERQEKYVQFVMKNPQVKYIKWSEQKQNFVDATQYSDASGILSPGLGSALEENELEELQMPGFVKDIGASIGIVNYNNREDVKKYFNKEMDKVFNGKQKPNWATEGTPQYEKAIDAAVSMKNHQIVWSSSLGKFKPMSGTAIGGGITSTY